MKNKLVVFLVLIIGSISFYYLISYLNFHKNYVTSNAVFIKSDTLTNLSFKIPGKIEHLYIEEGENLKKGELIAKLDTKELKFNKSKLEYQIQSLTKKIESLKIKKIKLKNDIDNNLAINNINLLKLEDNIKSKQYFIKAMEHKLNKLEEDYMKFKNLYKSNKISKDKFENIKTNYLYLKETINANRSILESLKKDRVILLRKRNMILNSEYSLKELTENINSFEKKVYALKEDLKLINQRIKDSFLYAPFNGKIAKKFVNNNEFIPAGKRVVTIVDLKKLYVLDLLEETKLNGIKEGCKVKIHIDALNKDYEGVVYKILPASASTFAILPRDISSGEFTKLSQRFYVKIKFNKVPDNLKFGMSGEVIINKCNRK